MGDRRFAILIARLELEGPGVGEISSMFTRKFVCDGGRVQVTPLIVFHHLRKSNWPCPGGGPPIFFPRSTRPRPISGTPLITLLMMIIYKILLNKEPQLRMTPSANCVTPLGSPCKPYQGNPIVSRYGCICNAVLITHEIVLLHGQIRVACHIPQASKDIKIGTEASQVSRRFYHVIFLQRQLMTPLSA